MKRQLTLYLRYFGTLSPIHHPAWPRSVKSRDFPPASMATRTTTTDQMTPGRLPLQLLRGAPLAVSIQHQVQARPFRQFSQEERRTHCLPTNKVCARCAEPSSSPSGLHVSLTLSDLGRCDSHSIHPGTYDLLVSSLGRLTDSGSTSSPHRDSHQHLQDTSSCDVIVRIVQTPGPLSVARNTNPPFFYDEGWRAWCASDNFHGDDSASNLPEPSFSSESSNFVTPTFYYDKDSRA